MADAGVSNERASASTRLAYVPALDGIRALAVAAVLIFHGGFAWASGGFLGVSTFFTLSGFLITSLLIGEREGSGRIALVAFWDRRFRRLLPAALVTLSGIALYGATLADTDQLWRLRGDTLSALAYVANWRFLVTGQAYEAIFSAPSPVQHFWSLAIEEQYYLFFPPFVVGLYALGRGRRGPLVIALASLVVASAVWMSLCLEPGGPISRAYYGTDTRAGELLTGALLAALWHGRGGPSSRRAQLSLQLAGVVGFAASLAAWGLATTDSRWLFHGGIAGYALASAALIAAVLQPGPLASFLAIAPLRGLGRISYGVYLYHWPIFLSLDADRVGIDGVPLFALRVATTLGVSVISFYAIERPIRLGRLRGDRRVWLGMPVALLAVASLQWVVTKNLEAPWYADLPAEAEATGEPSGEVLVGADAERRGRLANRSRVGRGKSGKPRRPGVLAWMVGDSAGMTFSAGLDDWGRQTRRLAVHNYALIGCSFVSGGSLGTEKGLFPRPERCDGWEEEWPAALDRSNPRIVFVMTGIWDLFDRKQPEWEGFRSIGDPVFDDYLISQYQKVVDLLSSRGALVIWLNLPCTDPDHPSLRPGGLLFNSPALSKERIDAYNDVILARLAASRPDRMRLLDLHSEMCPAGEYPETGLRYAEARREGVHYTREGAHEVSRWLGPLALQQLAQVRGADPAASRAGRPGRARVWVVGDSVGMTVGRGLESWGRSQRSMSVRNHGRVACSFARGGLLRTRYGEQPRPAFCGRWEEKWPAGLEKDRPDAVVVMTGLWDLLEVKLPEWSEFRSVGDPIFDDYLLSEYESVVDVASASGAAVLWLNQPCALPKLSPRIARGPLGVSGTLDQKRVDAYNAILSRLGESRTGLVRVVDLDAEVCPGGSPAPAGHPLAGAREDGIHFSRTKAFQLARWLGPLVLEHVSESRQGEGPEAATPAR